MAGNLPVPNGLEAKLVWSFGGTPFALNILHFSHEVGTTHTQARADTLSSIIATALTASGHGASLATGVTLARTESRHMDQNSDPWFIGSAAAVPGTGAGNPLPAATAFVVTLKTGLRGRSYNGRVYLWGFTEDANDAAGGITAAGSNNAVAFVSQVRTNAAVQLGLSLSVLSRFTTPAGSLPGAPSVERNPPVLTGTISVVALDSRWDTQRRRAIPGI